MTATPTVLLRPLGMLEWDSIALGLAATDALLKEAEVEPLLVRPVSPGRFVALFSGDVDSVRSALRRGAEVGAGSLVDSLFLPKPHPSIGPALGARTGHREVDAVGVIETLTLCALVLAADGAAKTGEVRLLEIRLGMGLAGKAFCTLTGEVSQVRAAIEVGAALASERGHHLRDVVIPRPDPRLVAFFLDPTPPFSDVLV